MSTESQCERCHEFYTKNSNAQKYCKACAYIVNLENARRSSSKKRRRDGALGPHPIRKKNGTLNIKAEKRAIEREMKRLGLRE